MALIPDFEEACAALDSPEKPDTCKITGCDHGSSGKLGFCISHDKMYKLGTIVNDVPTDLRYKVPLCLNVVNTHLSMLRSENREATQEEKLDIYDKVCKILDRVKHENYNSGIVSDTIHDNYMELPDFIRKRVEARLRRKYDERMRALLSETPIEFRISRLYQDESIFMVLLGTDVGIQEGDKVGCKDSTGYFLEKEQMQKLFDSLYRKGEIIRIYAPMSQER